MNHAAIQQLRDYLVRNDPDSAADALARIAGGTVHWMNGEEIVMIDDWRTTVRKVSREQYDNRRKAVTREPVKSSSRSIGPQWHPFESLQCGSILRMY